MKFKCQYKKDDKCSRYAIMDTSYCKWHLFYKLFKLGRNLRMIVSIILGIWGFYYFYYGMNCISIFLKTKSIIILFFTIFNYFPSFLFVLSLLIILNKLSDDILWPMFFSASLLLITFYPISQIIIWIIIGPTFLASLMQSNNIPYPDISANLNLYLITFSIYSVIVLFIFADILSNKPIILRLLLELRRIK